MTNKKTQPQMETHQINVGKWNIHYSEAGSGFPVIMLHGGGPGANGMSNYSRNVDALAKHYRVLVPDMPGYGQSTKGIKRSDPFGDLAKGILGLMDTLNIKQAHVVGNSLGGACALRMALDHPERVRSLVLMGPGGIGTTRGLPTKGLNKLLNYYTGSGPSLEKLTDFIRSDLVYDGSQVPDALIRDRYEASIDPDVVAQPPLRRPNSLPAAIRMDFTRDRRLKKCQIPTLVLWGKADKVNRPSGGRRLQSTMLNCDLYEFSKTGHWVQWERAEEFNAVTNAFMQENTPS
ncbi:alpha/beta fold hydrolase [Alcanivorax sp.]|jgi:pimeloyl-ACP methyl ester carboxylesterase|uniref:alpha/beta fold hydrolase n=1 Tax=Alcanivorax sp. TaxID=1872427 RepID=UPI0032D8FFFC